ncbi:MAG: ATP-binding protein [bacterium]
MSEKYKNTKSWFDRRLLVIVIIAFALLLFIFTWWGIQASRRDSFKLLVMQGTTFAEALAQASENAIASESFNDYLVHRRFHEIALFIADMPEKDVREDQLSVMALRHNLDALYICDTSGQILAEGTGVGSKKILPDFVSNEIKSLAANPESFYVLLLQQNELPQESIHYYLEITNNLDKVIVIAADAQYYTEALKNTQIGYLVQNMAREAGVEYIIYQSLEGIIFSSRKTGELLSIKSDPFLTEALDSDTIFHRKYVFQDKEVLELVRPFAIDEYPFGLFRVGLSLSSYNNVSKSYDRQMVLLTVVLFGFLLVGLLYFNSRQKRKQILRQYSEIKLTTSTIFDQMATGVASIDADGLVTLANKAFINIIGVKSLLNKQWNEIIIAPELKLENLKLFSNKNEEFEIELNIHGELKTLLVAVSDVVFYESYPHGMVVVVYDVTELKKYEHESIRKERLSEMGNLAAGVAHEIRNPLNTISIAAQRLALEYKPEDNNEEFIAFTNEIRSETKRLNEIITKFLALAREDVKKHSPINLEIFTKDFVRFITAEADELGIEISLDVEAGLIVDGEIDSLKQVFTNLFNNAKEALAKQDKKIIAIRAAREDEKVIITFSDNGPGINPEIRKKVITPYYTTKEAGTGLGLPTVHRIISEMHGSLTIADSELGGAKIIIKL